MVQVLLFISLFSNFNSDLSGAAAPSAASLGSSIDLARDEALKDRASSIEVRFDKSPRLTVGDPVIFNGAVVGSISKIEKSEEKKGVTNVSLRLSDENVPTDHVLVALAGSLKVPVNEKLLKGKKPSSSRGFLELLTLRQGSNKINEQEMVLKGYSSFHEFWTAQSSI